MSAGWDVNHIKMAVGVATCTAIAIGFIGWQMFQKKSSSKLKSSAKTSKDKKISNKTSVSTGKIDNRNAASDADESEDSSSLRGMFCSSP
jgi:hypothetical protein